MPRTLVKDRAAEADLIDIWMYSFQTWGEAQADRYLDAMEWGIGQLARDPDAGDPRHILHEVMDVGRHL